MQLAESRCHPAQRSNEMVLHLTESALHLNEKALQMDEKVAVM